MVSDSVTMCVPLQLVAATLKCTASLDVGVPDNLMMLFEVVASIQPGAYATNNALTMPNFSNPAEAARAWADEYEAKQRSALILLKRMRKPPFLDRSGGFALSESCELN